MDEACKVPDREILHSVVDEIRTGALLRLDRSDGGSTSIGDPKILSEIAYAVEKHLRK